MHQVYVIRSLKYKTKSYVGLTIKGVKNRLEEHNAGKSSYTKTFKPWKVVYFENFTCKDCAVSREKFLKSGFGYRFKKLILDNY